MFRSFLYECIARDFQSGELPRLFIEIYNNDIFLENEDLIKQGYRLITSKFPPYQNQKVWWKQGSPIIPATQQTEQPKTQEKKWTLATVIGDNTRLAKGSKVAASRRPDGNFDVTDASGNTMIVGKDQIANLIKSVKNPGSNDLIQSTDINSLLQSSPTTVKTEKPVQTEPAKSKSKTIPDELISDEQAAVDKQFEQILKSPNQSHIAISALAGSGKAQPLDSLLMTPSGWAKMGDIKIDDYVFGSDGLPHKVLGVFPQGSKEIFEVTFTDGAKVECCKDHLWLTETKRNRDKCRFYAKPLFSNASVSTAESIMNDLVHRGYPKHYIPLVQPLYFKKKETIIDPYVMGILLGDGCFRTGSVSYSTEDPEIVESVNNTLPELLTSKHTGYGCDYRISGDTKGIRNPIVKEIKNLGLWNKTSDEKFIPDIYKFNDFPSRVAILQGLLDTDGSASNHTVEYYTVSRQLSDDMRYLVESLGGVVKVGQKIPKFKYKGEIKTGKLCYRLNIKMPSEINPFRLARKRKKYIPKTKYYPKRAIVSIKSIGSKECQCISIDSLDNLYVTNNCVLTHNTTMLQHLAWKYGNKGQKWAYIVFNNRNKVEAKEKFPDFVQVETSNGFLGKVLSQNKANFPQTDRMANLSGEGGGKILEKSRVLMDGPEFLQFLNKMGINADINLSQYKTAKTLKSLLKSIQYSIKEQILTLVGLIKSFALDPRKPVELNAGIDKVLDSYDFDTGLDDIKERINKYTGYFKTEILGDLEDILGYDILQKDYKEEIVNGAKWLLNKTMPLGTSQTIHHGNKTHKLGEFRDFNDDLWFTAVHANEINWPHFDIVLADEVQDFNEAQKIMLKKLHDAGAKIVIVGDKNQSLYRFRGADAGAFDNLTNMVTDLSHDKNVSHKLTKNFRSKKAVIDFSNATTHVTDLKQGREFPDEGSATDKELKYEDVFNTLKDEKNKSGKVRETAFISRTNSPLVHAALTLLADNIPFVIVGKEIANDLKKHIAKIGAKFRLDDSDSVDDLKNKLDDFHNEEKEFHFGASTKKTYLEELKEVTDALTSSVDTFKSQHSGDSTISQFKSWLAQRLNGLDVAENEKDLAQYKEKMEKEHPVILTTAHRSKGLEFDRVYILRDDQFPHPKAVRQEDLDQEENAKYVARTRGKSEVHVLNPKGQPGYSEK